MGYKNINLQIDGPVAFVTVNRPDALNALDKETIAELDKCFSSLASDRGVLCVIFTGGSSKSFVSGADIGELASCDLISGKVISERGQAMLDKIEQLPQPVIAAINGYALGGGCEIAMACDIRLASEKAKLGQPEVGLGLIPGYGGTIRLARLVGAGKARQMILSGDHINASEAHRIGLVDGVYPPAELMPKAIEMARKIASVGPLAIKAAKRAINAALDIDIRRGCAYEASLFAGVCAMSDKNEGTAAFLEKRKPEFRGK